MKRSHSKNISMVMLCSTAALLTGIWQAQAQTDRSYSYQAHSTSVSRVHGAIIKDSRGANLGLIRDLLADSRTGNIDAAVISLNNATQPGTFTVVPWSLLRPVGDNAFEFSGDSNKLLTAQTFSSSRWPDFARSDYLPRVYDHYGLTYPSAVGAPGTGTGVQTGTRYEDTGPLWIRPQPDGKDVFPWLNHPEDPWKQ